MFIIKWKSWNRKTKKIGVLCLAEWYLASAHWNGILTFHLNLLLRQIWKSRASPQVENEAVLSTTIHIHPCIIINRQFLWIEKTAIPAKGLGKYAHGSLSPLLWLLHIVPVLWLATNPVADPMKSPLTKRLRIKMNRDQVTDHRNGTWREEANNTT